MAPPLLPALALGVALDHVLDHQGDVAAHAARADDEQEPADRADRGDQGEGHDDPVQATDGVGDGAENDRPGEAPEDERVHAEHGEADGSHLGRCGGGQGEEDADGERRDRGTGQELERHAQPELGHVEREDEEPAVGRDADAGDDEGPLRSPAEVAVTEHVGQREARGRRPGR